MCIIDTKVAFSNTRFTRISREESTYNTIILRAEYVSYLQLACYVTSVTDTARCVHVRHVL